MAAGRVDVDLVQTRRSGRGGVATVSLCEGDLDRLDFGRVREVDPDDARMRGGGSRSRSPRRGGPGHGEHEDVVRAREGEERGRERELDLPEREDGRLCYVLEGKRGRPPGAGQPAVGRSPSGSGRRTST